MSFQEELAHEFLRVPIDVLGVYRTQLETNGRFCGHADKPTTKCALFIILRGQAEFIFDQKEKFVLQAGEGFFGGLNKRLELYTGEHETEYFLVHYLPIHSELGNARLLTEVSVFGGELDPVMLQLLEKLQTVAALPDMLGQLEKKSYFYRLVSAALQADRSAKNKESYPVINDAATYIRQHYDEKLTLEQLAARYGMRGKYFSHLFQRFMGIAPIDYLIRYRMRRAEELLHTTSAPIHEIAEAVGYTDPNYFSRLYKTHMGISPKLSRETQRLIST